MAGDVLLTKDAAWSASSSPFHWVVSFLARTFSGDVYIGPVAKVIDEENISFITLEEFSSDNQRKILVAFSTKLVPDARERLPKDMPQRDEYIEQLQELADKAMQLLEPK